VLTCDGKGVCDGLILYQGINIQKTANAEMKSRFGYGTDKDIASTDDFKT